MAKTRIHLLCNAHLDPVWLWEWEEGAAEAISTFRVAADLIEQFPGFIFNHNEVTLYKWVEEYEPVLFKRIQRLVRQGKWHIMGGWYLQPDCNMPSGESFVRQILVGKRYFKEKFGVEPTTAINFDPFGHSRGLPQILAKAGYDSYLFCRPGQDDCALPADDFTWVGYDGTEITASRVVGWYNSPLGKAHEKIAERMKNHPKRDFSLLLWGVGNHGGGPSRDDLTKITKLIEQADDFEIVHSTSDAYFAELHKKVKRLPKHKRDLNPWGVGCYTSQIRIKQKHRLLENEIYATEKMVTTAACQGLMKYPRQDLYDALCDLLVGEFHDILPGSSIQPVEDASLRLFDHALEKLSRIKARAFFSLASGQPKAKEGKIPILVYNPHPYPVRTTIECEFQLPDSRWDGTFTLPTVWQKRKQIPAQCEKELSNLCLDWRKRMVFEAELAPSSMNRFDCRHDQVLESKPEPALKERNGRIVFKTDELNVVINTKTGLIDRYRANGVDYLEANAFWPLVMKDDEDPWGMRVKSFRKSAGKFKLMSRKEGTTFSGVVKGVLPSVRVIEDGDVRTVVEAVMRYGDSFICQHYKLPKRGTEIEVQTRVHWNEKDKMLKLSIPTRCRGAAYVGQTAYGIADLPADGNEAVAQKWVAAVDRKSNKAITVVNDGIYGSDFVDGELRLSLLRSPAFSGHPFWDRLIVVQDRYLPRIDQGERLYRFWFNGGKVRQRLDAVDREALVRNEKPFALSFYPPGQGSKPKTGPTLSDNVVQITAMKYAENGRDIIVRLFEPTGKKRSTTLRLPFVPMSVKVDLKGFEIKTLKINPRTKKASEVNLLER